MTSLTVVVPDRRVSARRLRGTLYWLVQDWLMLSRQLPAPVAERVRRSSNARRAYGHPAEWASDEAALIAEVFWSWHDLVAELRGERRPHPPVVGGRRRRSEESMIREAYRYLDPRLDDLLESGWVLPVPYADADQWEWTVADDAFDELFAMHGRIRARTGQTNVKQILPMPCPNSDCGLKALERVIGMHTLDGRDRQEFVVCGACGYRVPEPNYRFLTRVLLDQVLADGEPTTGNSPEIPESASEGVETC